VLHRPVERALQGVHHFELISPFVMDRKRVSLRRESMARTPMQIYTAWLECSKPTALNGKATSIM